jgi:hypothetical protein
MKKGKFRTEIGDISSCEFHRSEYIVTRSGYIQPNVTRISYENYRFQLISHTLINDSSIKAKIQG